MSTINDRLAALGTAIPSVLLPSKSTSLSSWAVIACDQFTQDRDYWKQVDHLVGNNPSTLRMILPEVFLEDGDRATRLGGIRAAMKDYLDNDVFAPTREAVIYIERDTPHQKGRKGLVLAVDLERYEWAPEARPLIRATEGTVKERIPPRMEIRRGAPIESPHILLLIDDREQSLIEGLGKRAQGRAPSYETSLMLNSGSIRGWALDTAGDFEYLADGLERLAASAATAYGTDDTTPFLYAVGDGNHSLATAKAVWDEYKATHAGEADLMKHPARFALVEVENIYDRAIEFEPIHRALFGTSLAEVAAALGALPDARTQVAASAEALKKLVDEPFNGNRYGLVSAQGHLLVETTASGIATEPLQGLLDRFVAGKAGRSIDYLHGTEETVRVAQGPGAVGILLPPVGKADLFSTVARSGPLPRKSFSMGEAVEKRFYLECRRLFS